MTGLVTEIRMKSTSRRPYRAWLLLAALLVLSGGRAFAFEVHRHYFMTLQAMDRLGVKGSAKKLIAYYAIAPDLDGCFQDCYACPPGVADTVAALGVTCPTPEHLVETYYSRHHFDNMMLERGRRAVITIWVHEARQELLGITLVDGKFTEAGAIRFERAMKELGAAIHAVQDFYAHSTWIECEQPDPPVWHGLTDLEDCSETLASGTQVDGLMSGCEGLSKCTSATHEELNKDKPWSEEGEVATGGAHGYATFYQLAAGDGSESTAGEGPFDEPGLAPLHTRRVYKSFSDSQRVFRCCAMTWEKVTGCGACGGPVYSDFSQTSSEDVRIVQLMQIAADDDEVEDRADDLPLSVVGLFQGMDSLGKQAVLKVMKSLPKR